MMELKRNNVHNEFTSNELLMNDLIDQINDLVKEAGSKSKIAYEKYGAGNGAIFGDDSAAIISDLCRVAKPLLKQIEPISHEAYLGLSQIIIEYCMLEAEKCLKMIRILEQRYGLNSFTVFLQSMWCEILKLGSIDMSDSFRKEFYSPRKLEFKKVLDSLGLNSSENINSVQKTLSDNAKTGCFIATMAYGDYYHPQVIFLRDYRDNRLRKYFLGRLAIHLYYYLSPKIVALCRGNLKIVNILRLGLDWLINNILKSQNR